MDYFSKLIDVDIETPKSVDVGFSTPRADLDFGGITIIDGAGNNVYMNTTAFWNAQPQLIGKKGSIYVYTDYDYYVDDDGNVIYTQGVKIADGVAYLIDQPFIDGSIKNSIEQLSMILDSHVNNKEIHITEEERKFWNNKVTCYQADNEEIVFTKDFIIE